MKLEFEKFPKLSRMKRECTITEKIDGTNAQINFDIAGNLLVGSRKREIWPNGHPGKDKNCDNYTFALWVYTNRDALFNFLGEGRHYGEWAGHGIQRGYGLETKRFYLFNSFRFGPGRQEIPKELSVYGLDTVPVLSQGMFDSDIVNQAMLNLNNSGSHINNGFMNPEGVVVYHHALKNYFKVTYEHDMTGKGPNRQSPT